MRSVGFLAAVCGAVVEDPAHPVGAGVGFDGHDLLDETTERGDAGARLAAAEDLAARWTSPGQVGQRAAAVVLVLDPHGAGPPGWQGAMAAAAGLYGGLLVRAEHV